MDVEVSRLATYRNAADIVGVRQASPTITRQPSRKRSRFLGIRCRRRDLYAAALEFIEQLHKLVARSQNALRGRWENLWSTEQTCVVKLVGREAVLDKLVYTATNPVQDHLVEGVHHWPGGAP